MVVHSAATSGKRGRSPSRTAKPKTEFGFVFSRYRAASRISLRELAARLGYSPGSYRNIHAYETGDRLPPGPTIVLEMMEALGYGVNDEETQVALIAALDDQIRTIHPSFRRGAAREG